MDIVYGILSIMILMCFIMLIVIMRDINLKLVNEKTDEPIKNKRRVQRYYSILVLMFFVDFVGTGFLWVRFPPTTNLYLSMTDSQVNFSVFIFIIAVFIVLFYGEYTYQKRLKGCLDTKGIQIDHSKTRAGILVFGPYGIAIGMVGQMIIELVLLFMISILAGVLGILVIMGISLIGLWLLEKPLEFWFRKKTIIDSKQ